MTKKTALITGANKGIGYGLARELTEKGYEVWIGARNPDLGLKAAHELKAKFIQIDVTDPKSVETAFKEFSKTHDSLDLLVNNAGVYLMGKDDLADKATLESIKQTFDVNFLGVISVSQTFLPLVKKAKGHILNISSGMGSQGLMSDPNSFIKDYPMMLGYCSSKAALNTFTILMAKQVKEFGVRVNSICPGYVDTELNGHSGVLTTSESAKNIYKRIIDNNTETGVYAQADGVYPW